MNNLEGLSFGRLIVIERCGISKCRSIVWRCLCTCGNFTSVRGSLLVAGRIQSCGCLQKDIAAKNKFIHGLSRHKFYHTWKSMIRRCYNSTDKTYQYYGGRGITVCDEWKSKPEGLKTFIEWCEKENPLKGFTLDRKESNGNYSPDNCRFISNMEQQRNKTNNIWVTHKNKTLLFIDLVREYNVISYGVALTRVNRSGWDPIKAAITPPYQRGEELL